MSQMNAHSTKVILTTQEICEAVAEYLQRRGMNAHSKDVQLITDLYQVHGVRASVDLVHST